MPRVIAAGGVLANLLTVAGSCVSDRAVVEWLLQQRRLRYVIGPRSV